VQIGRGAGVPEVITVDIEFDGARSVSPLWETSVARSQAQVVHPTITNTANQSFHLVASKELRLCLRPVLGDAFPIPESSRSAIEAPRGPKMDDLRGEIGFLLSCMLFQHCGLPRHLTAYL
jgi:hypothetical protein